MNERYSNEKNDDSNKKSIEPEKSELNSDKQNPVTPKKRLRLSPRAKDNISFTIKLIVGLGLFYFLYRSINPAKLKSILYSVDIRYLLAGIASFLIAVVVSAATWKILLIPLGLEISWTQVVILRIISFFINNTLPSGVAGDAWRAYYYGVQEKNPGASFASVLVEKWVSFVSLAVFSLLALILGNEQFKEFNIFVPVLIFVIFMSIAVILSIIMLPWFIRNGRSFFKRYGINNPYLVGIESLHVYQEKKEFVLYSLLVTCLSPLIGVFAFYFIGLSIGCKPPLISYFILVPLIRVINHIPISVNSIGTQDVTIVVFMAQYGITRESGISMSLLAHLLKIIVGAIGGVCYLFLVFEEKKLRGMPWRRKKPPNGIINESDSNKTQEK
ncbi:MAG: flippase-like domain-containing protein [Candidatus Eremiobacteraeota bacterium]|nr:flippase-like domain-containing protein [Candidatus Eremiobacteraeota bacterium]